MAFVTSDALRGPLAYVDQKPPFPFLLDKALCLTPLGFGLAIFRTPGHTPPCFSLNFEPTTPVAVCVCLSVCALTCIGSVCDCV